MTIGIEIVRDEFRNLNREYPAFTSYRTRLTKDPARIAIEFDEDTAGLAREALEEAPYLLTQMGEVVYKRWDGSMPRSGLKLGDICKVVFLPFGESPYCAMPWILRKGLGSQVEYLTSKDMLSRSKPNDRIIHRHPTDVRQRQLAKLGIEINLWYRIDNQVRIVEEHLSQHGIRIPRINNIL